MWRLQMHILLENFAWLFLPWFIVITQQRPLNKKTTFGPEMVSLKSRSRFFRSSYSLLKQNKSMNWRYFCAVYFVQNTPYHKMYKER